MNDTPTTTLTQRRSQITVDGTKKLQKEKLSHNEVTATGAPADRGSVVRIVAWIMVMVFIGVGTALLITSLARDDKQEPTDTTAENTPESFPVTDTATEPEPEGTEEEPSEEAPETDEPTDTETPEPTAPSPVTGGDISEFSDSDRTRTSASNSNNLILNNFKFYSENKVFYYIFYNVTTTAGSIDPTAKLTYDGNNLQLELSNIHRDNVTGQNNNTNRTIYGLPGITGTQTQNRGAVSTYKYLMNQKLKSRLLIDQEKREIRVEIQLP